MVGQSYIVNDVHAENSTLLHIYLSDSDRVSYCYKTLPKYCPYNASNTTARAVATLEHLFIAMQTSTFNNSYCPTALAHSTIHISPLCWHIQQFIFPHCVSTFNKTYCPTVLAHSTIRISPLCWHIQQFVLTHCVSTFNKTYCPTALAHSTIHISPLCWHIQQFIFPHCVSTFNKTYCPTVLAHSTIRISPLCWHIQQFVLPHYVSDVCPGCGDDHHLRHRSPRPLHGLPALSRPAPQS